MSATTEFVCLATGEIWVIDRLLTNTEWHNLSTKHPEELELLGCYIAPPRNYETEQEFNTSGGNGDLNGVTE
jgi:hypothetical protein